MDVPFSISMIWSLDTSSKKPMQERNKSTNGIPQHWGPCGRPRLPAIPQRSQTHRSGLSRRRRHQNLNIQHRARCPLASQQEPPKSGHSAMQHT
ncbi:hypothetical protein F751_0716 [Auxenochlorella protothecoides]|uniref:Uncharacterized protein n=1 Tax=Auxenochlorella protothecoides TaxID=3075 RepID=A0A087SM30_AUXPR|nr:hypothetical protein F751_0716 [Auxenochlorella protothecoides]KFM26784.1 hypothetical protein F751_0716 [Auxenochlorella protothecoides]